MQERTFYMLIAIIAIMAVSLIMLLISFIKQKKEKKSVLKQNKELSEEYKEINQENQELLSANKALNEKHEVLREAKEKAEKLAFTDYMTDLSNHTAFIEMMNTVMLTLRNNETISIMGLDIDNFKDVNDLLGSTYGDQVLIDIANRLLDTLDENDFLARTGGDEFTIISQNITDLADYEIKIKKFQKIFSYPFLIAGREIFITVSIGITVVPRDGRNTHVLLKNINSAIYVAKLEGKNRYVYFDESINKKLTEKLEIQSDIRKAFEEGQFKIYYKAQADLMTEQIKGFEALYRWEHPQKGFLESFEFLPYAEKAGLIIQIGKSMIIDSCRQIKEWQDKGYNDLKLTVNLSLCQFKDKDLVKNIIDSINEAGFDSRYLVLEISKQTAIDDLDYTIETIEALKLCGITFSLVNFEPSYSSVNYLKVLPVSILKIDKNFVDLIISDNIDKRIKDEFIKAAQYMKVLVAAEDIEPVDYEEFLSDVGGNIVQGYIYSKPMAGDNAEQMLCSGWQEVKGSI